MAIVNLNVSGFEMVGTPTLPVRIGGSLRAVPCQHQGSTYIQLSCSYVVVAGDYAPDGVEVLDRLGVDGVTFQNPAIPARQSRSIQRFRRDSRRIQPVWIHGGQMWSFSLSTSLGGVQEGVGERPVTVTATIAQGPIPETDVVLPLAVADVTTSPRDYAVTGPHADHHSCGGVGRLHDAESHGAGGRGQREPQGDAAVRTRRYAVFCDAGRLRDHRLAERPIVGLARFGRRGRRRANGDGDGGAGRSDGPGAAASDSGDAAAGGHGGRGQRLCAERRAGGDDCGQRALGHRGADADAGGRPAAGDGRDDRGARLDAGADGERDGADARGRRGAAAGDPVGRRRRAAGERHGRDDRAGDGEAGSVGNGERGGGDDAAPGRLGDGGRQRGLHGVVVAVGPSDHDSGGDGYGVGAGDADAGGGAGRLGGRERDHRGGGHRGRAEPGDGRPGGAGGDHHAEGRRRAGRGGVADAAGDRRGGQRRLHGASDDGAVGGRDGGGERAVRRAVAGGSGHVDVHAGELGRGADGDGDGPSRCGRDDARGRGADAFGRRRGLQRG